MGLRGPLPARSVKPADKLKSLSAPDWLTDDAASFWQRHAGWLAKNELLTAATGDTFALCCELWGECRELGVKGGKAYLDALKAFHVLAKLFRLVPCDKPGATAATRHEDKEEFTF